ncbi:MAG: hypothetical protein RR388_07915, partial [Rikenellaceae bacterium]
MKNCLIAFCSMCIFLMTGTASYASIPKNESNEKLTCWIVDGLERIERSQTMVDNVHDTIFLYVAKNELESGQIVLRSELHDFDVLKVDFTSLKSDTNTINASNLNYQFALYELALQTENKGHTGFANNGTPLYPKNEMPDPLSNAKTITVPCGKN